MCALLTEEYEAYMKEQQVTMKQEVVAMEAEPRVADVPPVFITAQEPTSTTVISGQVWWRPKRPSSANIDDY